MDKTGLDPTSIFMKSIIDSFVFFVLGRRYSPLIATVVAISCEYLRPSTKKKDHDKAIDNRFQKNTRNDLAPSSMDRPCFVQLFLSISFLGLDPHLEPHLLQSRCCQSCQQFRRFNIPILFYRTNWWWI